MFRVDGPSGAQWYPDLFATDPARRGLIEHIFLALAELPRAAK